MCSSMPYHYCRSIQSTCAALRKHIYAQLGIADNATPDEIAAAIEGTPYRRDYHVTTNTICNLRRKHVDVLWRLRERDVDSCFAAVRCLLECK
jgi:hypothetical protein